MSNKEFNKWFDLGSEAFNKKDFLKAIECYDKAIEIDPNNSNAYNGKGNALDDLGRYEKALKCYDKAIEIDPNNSNNGKGNALSKLGRYEEALKCYDKAIEIDPNNSNAYNGKGNALSKLGRYEEALKYYDKAIEIDPNNSNAYNGKGIALRNLGRYEEALECYDKAIEIDPNYSNAYNNKGNALSKLGRYEEALECYDKAIEIDPNYSNAYNNKGNALSKLGRYEEALECYDKAIEIDPKNSNTYNNKGIALSNLGRYEEALECYDKAIEIDPNYSNAYNNKGNALSKLGRYEEALECYDKAIEIDPKNSNTYNSKGVTLYKLGKYKEALKYFDKIIELDPNFSNVYYDKSEVLGKLGRYEEALEYFDKAIELAPKNIYLAVKFLMDLGVSIDKIEALINSRDKDIWDQDEIFNSIIGKNYKEKERKQFKTIWLYQCIILYTISFKSKGKDKEKEGKYFEIAHYTSYGALKHLLGFNDEKIEPTSIRITSLSTANDLKEGSILLEILKDRGIFITPHENQLVPLQISFSKNKDSLTMFRLYGKDDNKEATGVCLVFNEDFFDTESISEPMTISNEKMDATPIPKENSQKKENKESPKLSLFHVLYYDKDNQALIFNKKETKHGYNIIIPLKENKNTNIKNIEDENDDKTIINLIQYSFAKIIKTIHKIKTHKNKQVCYDLLINLQYLIKHDAWLEETELRILQIVDIDTDGKIDYKNDKIYKDYLKILNNKDKYLTDIILGTKIEESQSKKETINRFLIKKYYDPCVTVSEAPLK